MRRLLCGLMLMSVAMFSSMGRANDVAHDTSDPLYLQSIEEVFSQSSISYWDHVLRVGQGVSYGLNNRLTIGANVHYQHDFNGPEDGFSAVDLRTVYRVGNAEDNDANLITDVLFGFKFGGSSRVRTPDYADSTYYLGVRMGRQWAGVTLAATLKSTWVFDDERGVAFLDLTPEAYFRIAPDWRFGIGFTVRKATSDDRVTEKDYDQEWLHLKLVRQYGRTQYIGHVDYEFESEDTMVGAKVNILF